MDLELFNRINVFNDVREARVRGHLRHSKLGRTINVRAYDRDMPTPIRYKTPIIGTHLSSNMASTEKGFELRDLGISIARKPREEQSSPTVNDITGTKGRLTVAIRGLGLDYTKASHKAYIDSLYDKLGPPFDTNVIKHLRQQGISWVNGWNGIGRANELHVINPKVISIKKRELREATTRVKQHRSRSKKGKVFSVKDYERQVEPTRTRMAPAIRLSDGTIIIAKESLHGDAIRKAYIQMFPEKAVKKPWLALRSTGLTLDELNHYGSFQRSFYADEGFGQRGYSYLDSKGIQRFITVRDFGRMDRLREARVRVKAYTRVLKGKRQQVRASTRNVKTPAQMKIIGATPNEKVYVRKILARHDPRVLAAVPFVAVLDRKDFMKMGKNNKADPNYKFDGSEIGWYDEKKGFIAINRTPLVANEFQAVLDHELGHAAYYHSPELAEWNRAARDPKFDRFTWYAKQEGPHEGFAETYMAYIAAGGKAKQPKYKKAFAVVRKVISAVNPKTNLFDDMPLPRRPK